jgi:hypothetical protein
VEAATLTQETPLLVDFNKHPDKPPANTTPSDEYDTLYKSTPLHKLVFAVLFQNNPLLDVK